MSALDTGSRILSAVTALWFWTVNRRLRRELAAYEAERAERKRRIAEWIEACKREPVRIIQPDEYDVPTHLRPPTQETR